MLMSTGSSKSSNVEGPESCDFAILAVQHRELLSTLEVVDHVDKARSSRNAFYRVRVTSPNPGAKTLKGVVAATGGVGRVQGAVAASHLLHLVTPKWLFLIGVAGGFSANNVALGDLIIASRIIDYEEQRLTDEGQEFRLRTFEADELLLKAAKLAGETN